ncbi:MAG: hypothetical protein KR126chlam2_00193 [Chlamydiae bacterium]|nr:hypothetical protein [Chlamydiota bacterium]
MLTTFKTPTDFRKSLEARLKNIAIKDAQDLQRLRRKVAFERLLARIFHRDNSSFVLKGGYAMELRFTTARATKDIDLTCLHRIDNTHTVIEQIIMRELQKLVKVDLDDYFFFEIGKSQMDLDNAPYGGARYAVSSFVDKRLFIRFQLDVGADVVVDEIDQVSGSNWLNYCGIATPIMQTISIEQQLAEKLHAYTLPRSERVNTRVKDLIDMLLLAQLRQINKTTFNRTLRKVFKARETHIIPKRLEQPPEEWLPLYQALAKECGLTQEMSQAYDELSSFFQSFVS